MRKIIYTSIALFSCATSVKAEPSSAVISGYLSSQNDEKVATAKLAVVSTAQGVFWASAFAANEGVDLYCPPQNLVVTPDQYVSIFKRYIAENPNRREDALGLTVTAALLQTFPCH